MILFIVIVNIMLGVKLVWDYKDHHNPDKLVNHPRSVIIDGTVYNVAAFVFFGWPECIAWVWLAASYRWIMFDLIFNKINGWAWDYYGTTSWYDRQMRKTGRWHIVIKLASLAIGIILIKIL